MNQTFSYERLFNFAYQVFLKMGCIEEHAILATRVLLSADMRGVDSHGVARLSGYVRLWDAKRINAIPNIKIVHETPSTRIAPKKCPRPSPGIFGGIGT